MFVPSQMSISTYPGLECTIQKYSRYEFDLVLEKGRSMSFDGNPSIGYKATAIQFLTELNPALESPLLSSGLELAMKYHPVSQKRDNGDPFIVHPVQTAGILARIGCPESIVHLGLIHDIIDKNQDMKEDIRKDLCARYGSAGDDHYLSLGKLTYDHGQSHIRKDMSILAKILNRMDLCAVRMADRAANLTTVIELLDRPDRTSDERIHFILKGTVDQLLIAEIVDQCYRSDVSISLFMKDYLLNEYSGHLQKFDIPYITLESPATA
jgi:hypothetical protein